MEVIGNVTYSKNEGGVMWSGLDFRIAFIIYKIAYNQKTKRNAKNEFQTFIR